MSVALLQPALRDITLAKRLIDTASLDLDFARNSYKWDEGAGLVSKALADIVTFTRASAATRFNAAGVLESVATDVPRLDYDPVTLQARGLLVERQRTNLLLWSRDLTNAVWVKSNTTAALTATGIDGAANSASVVTASANNGTILQSITSASAERATTAYVKRRTGTGTVEMTQDGGATWAPITINSSTYTRVGPASATVTNPQVGFRLATSGDQIDVDIVGCENGSLATSAIPTTSAQVTRAADNAVINTLSPWFNASEGTLFVAASVHADAALAQLASFDDGTSSTRIQFRHTGTTSASALISASGVVTANIVASAGLWPGGVARSGALAWAVDGTALVAGGGSPVTDTSVVLPTVTRLALASPPVGVTSANCHISRLVYFPRRLTNTELQRLTA